MTQLDLSIALERYDRHVPFFMGSVPAPDGLTLRPYEVGMAPPRRDGVDRHRRFLEGKEFDIAETSLSSHVIATSRGAPFVGIPVFPRRLFSQNHIFVNVDSGIEQPRDLIALDETGVYRGMYHVLLGRIAPLEGIGPEQLTIDALVERVRQGDFREIIMATNPTVEGDGTALHISNLLAEFPVTITRLARGVTSGSVLEFATVLFG